MRAVVAALVGLTLLAAGSAKAATVRVSELSADGLTVVDMTCELNKGGMFAGMAVVGALAKKKKAFDKCGPKGAAARVAFRWAGGKTTNVVLVSASAKKTGACVVKVLRKLKSGLGGKCALTVLTGPKKAAKKAAAGLPKKAPKKTDNPYDEDKAWTALSHDGHGWEMIVLKSGKKPVEVSVDLGKDRWQGAKASHDHQLVYVLWHPKAPLGDKTLEMLTHKAVTIAKGAQWKRLKANTGSSNFGSLRVEHTTVNKKYLLLRVAATGARGQYFFLSVHPTSLSTDVANRWVRSLNVAKK